MIVVVDASVAAKWILAEADSDRAAALRSPADDFIAPSLVLAEIGNAICKAALRRDVDAQDATDMLQIAAAHYARIVPLDELGIRAIELAIELRHPIYDCFYLALAERERAPLVTADGRLLAAAKKAKVTAKKL